jgi:hypothetical protein
MSAGIDMAGVAFDVLLETGFTVTGANFPFCIPPLALATQRPGAAEIRHASS